MQAQWRTNSPDRWRITYNLKLVVLIYICPYSLWVFITLSKRSLLMAVFPFSNTADAMVSTGLSALGYKYINLGINFYFGHRKKYSLTVNFFSNMNFNFWVDDCWAELNRDSKVHKQTLTVFEFSVVLNLVLCCFFYCLLTFYGLKKKGKRNSFLNSFFHAGAS